MLGKQYEENLIGDIGAQYLSDALRQNQVKPLECSLSFSSSLSFQ